MRFIHTGKIIKRFSSLQRQSPNPGCTTLRRASCIFNPSHTPDEHLCSVHRIFNCKGALDTYAVFLQYSLGVFTSLFPLKWSPQVKGSWDRRSIHRYPWMDFKRLINPRKMGAKWDVCVQMPTSARRDSRELWHKGTKNVFSSWHQGVKEGIRSRIHNLCDDYCMFSS